MSLRNESKEPSITSKKPKLIIAEAYNAQLEKTADSISNEKVRSIIQNFLKLTRQKIAEQEGFYPEIEALVNLIENDREAVKRKAPDRNSLMRAEAVLNGVKNIIIPHKNTYYPAPVVIPKTSAHWHEHSMRLQLETLLLNANFRAALAKVASKGRVDGSVPYLVYMCFSESSKKLEYLSWVKPFIHNLADLLRTAGLRVCTYERNIRDFFNIYGYMKQIEDPKSFILLFGTESLLEDNENFSTEYVYIKRKIATAQESKTDHHVTPILLSGTAVTSLPSDFSSLESPNWINPEKTFFQNFCNLVNKLYGEDEAFFKPIWDEFLAVEANRVLTLGLTEEMVNRHLAAEKQERENNIAARDRAAQELLGVRSSGQSTAPSTPDTTSSSSPAVSQTSFFRTTVVAGAPGGPTFEITKGFK